MRRGPAGQERAAERARLRRTSEQQASRGPHLGRHAVADLGAQAALAQAEGALGDDGAGGQAAHVAVQDPGARQRAAPRRAVLAQLRTAVACTQTHSAQDYDTTIAVPVHNLNQPLLARSGRRAQVVPAGSFPRSVTSARGNPFDVSPGTTVSGYEQWRR